MSWRENTNLYLNTQLIDVDYTKANVENEKGGWINNRQVFWFNINFKTLLGDLYDKYDTFNMSLIFSHIFAPANNNFTGNCYFNVAGLDFVNNGYNQITQNNRNSAVLRYHTSLQASGQVYGGERDAFVVTFRKPNQNVRLEFFHTQIVTNEITPSNVVFGTANLFFNIRPCVKPSLFANNLSDFHSNLVLSTSKISTSYSTLSVDNEVGSWGPITSNGRARQRFSFNVNMRNLLGNLWETHKQFALILSSIMIYIDPDTPLVTGVRMLIYMRGLNFRNTYTQASNVPSGTVPLIYWPISATTGLVTPNDRDSRTFPFIKQEANVKLEFDVYDYITTLPYVDANNAPMPTFVMKFVVMPLD